LKISNNIPDIAAAAGKYVESGEKYYDNIAEIEMQLSLVKFIRDYLTNPKNKTELIPANIGIADIGIEEQILKYNEECLKFGKLAAASGDQNPWSLELEKSMALMRSNIMRSIDNQYSSLQIKRAQAQAQENISKQRIATVPTQEKEINDVVRQQKIKETLYLYLLNKREENALQLAITEPNAKIVESASGTDIPVYPSTLNILVLGFMIGLILPAAVLYLIFWIHSLDTKIHNRRDIELLTSVPVVGEIPSKKKSQEEQEIIVTSTGKDRISEAFRMIRGNLDFMLRNDSAEASVIQLTSTMPGEGKSYIAVNLALSFAQTGKKVLAIDMDLRKGNLSKIIGERGHVGLSAYLSG
ncbi:MAG: GNVR domain-containing protein, partial [Muribaculaceae bacterium]